MQAIMTPYDRLLKLQDDFFETRIKSMLEQHNELFLTSDWYLLMERAGGTAHFCEL